VVQGVDHIVPVDMYLPGCPPRPEMLMDAILKLHDKIMDEPLGVNARRRELPGYAPRELVASSQRFSPEGKKAAREAFFTEIRTPAVDKGGRG
jgi:NADH-quinone oxidoreductase subunit B